MFLFITFSYLLFPKILLRFVCGLYHGFMLLLLDKRRQSMTSHCHLMSKLAGMRVCLSFYFLNLNSISTLALAPGF
uniref:Putative secreted peptide n=1 Tax=Anopheles braziliensis TaxID=58242 RepID=A0A2M3ZTF7_9DIPT